MRHHPRDVPGRRIAAASGRQGRRRRSGDCLISATTKGHAAALDVVVADIATLAVDAIVNAANNSLLGGGGVDGAIHRAAGPGLLAACRELNGCATGDAKIRPGFGLPARHVIHAVGPVWYGGGHREDDTLAQCYRRAVRIAADHNLTSLAFSAISTGVYGFPADRAARIAVTATREALDDAPSLTRVIFCCFSELSAEMHRAAIRDA